MYLINFKDIVFTTLNKLLYFIGGICIGILVVLLIYLIVTIISNKLKNKKTNKIVIETSKNYLNNIINTYKQKYITEYSNKVLKDRVSSLKEISSLLIKDIAITYHPESKNPLLEISLEQLLNFSNHLVSKIDQTVSDIIDSSFFKVVWVSYASIQNIKGFIKGIFKKEKDPVLSLNVRKLKLSYVLNELDKIRNNTNNINKESSENKKYFLLDDYINNKLLMLIEEIAYEASLIYSNHDYEGGTN